MAVNFGLLQPAAPVSAFFQGQQDVRAEADRNMLRQQQAEKLQFERENMLAQRGEREALAADRRAKTAAAAQRQQFLSGLGAKMAEGGYKLDRPTLGQMLQFGMQTGEDSLIKLATEGMRALDEEDLYTREAERFGLGGAAAPAAPVNALPAAPAAPVNMFAGTMADIGTTQPAPVNALAAPPAAAGVTREMVQNMLTSPSARIREQGKALVATLEKDQPGARLQDRFVPVGKVVFDRLEQRYITPPQAAIAATQDRAAPAGARQKAPSGYRFTPSGDLEPIPGGPATRATESKPLTPQQETQRRDKLGKEFKSAVNALQTTQDVLDSLQNVKDAPGLDRATGYLGVYAPSIPEGAAAQAETRFQNLKGKVTALGKAQAASTGAIGSIANQEWKILADQIAALELVKGTGPLLEQLDLVEAQAQGTMERIRDAYQRQFGEDFERFPQFKDLPAPKSTIKSRKSGGPVTPATPAATGTGRYQNLSDDELLRQLGATPKGR
jgi:hypothetical protein